MSPKTGQDHILGRGGSIQAREDVPHGLAMIGADAALVASLEKPL